jgi:hypothetical protein
VGSVSVYKAPFPVAIFSLHSLTKIQQLLPRQECQTFRGLRSISITERFLIHGGTMLRTSIAVAVMSFSVLGLSACDVEKTQEGNVTVPKYEVEKKQAGNVTAPNYDVKTPDVAVTTQEKRVEVPTIETKEKTVEVPNVEITPAKER